MSPYSWKCVVVLISHLRTGSFRRKILTAAILALATAGGLNAQADSSTPVSAAVGAPGQSLVQPTPARITSAIDGKQLLVLKGNTHPLAQAQFDRGMVSSAEPMTRMLLLLQRSPEQESALRQYLDDQQTKTSLSYQRWVTPEEFGMQFGPADADIQTVTQWLESQGFQVNRVAASRMVIEFSGTAGQVQSAFHTAMHHFVVDGKDHVANADDPQIPVALTPVVAGVVSLHNFGRKSHARVMGMVQRNLKTGKTTPLITLPYGSPAFYGVGPSDFAKIYNTQALWDAGIDGTGQSVAVVGETNINLTDVQAFRSIFGLPNNDPEIILNGEDPGITSIDEEAEADLDVQWSGAVAKNAKIKFVVSASTPASAGVDLSALYIIEHNLAGVMSESYGECEKNLLTAGNQFYKTLWQQAAAQGITVVISSGDGGSAGCDNFNTQETATQGIAVSGFASTPYNVSVGGTDFNQYNVWSSYWTDTNDPVTQLSAKSYIPEVPWNQNCAQLGITKCGSTAPNGSVNIVAASGGPSTVYPKPSWQMGVTGMPNDSHRDQPDVSLFASPGFSGSAYIYCQGDYQGGTQPCVLLQDYYYNFPFIGGTSASAPAFAGIMALVNHYQTNHGGNGRQGVANYTLYALAKKSGSSCTSTANPAATCVFYDVTNKGNIGLSGSVGTISVPCKGATPNCSSSAAATNGVLVDPANKNVEAWTGGASYDMATGLGTVNAYNLAVNWGTVSTIGTTTTLTLNPTTGITHGTAENVSVSSTVTQASGNTKPTGTISLIATMSDGSTLGLDTFTLTNGAVTAQKAQSLPGGTYKISAHYAGDGINAPSDSSLVQVTVGQEASKTFIVIPSFDSRGTQISGNANSVVYGGSYIIRMYVTDKNGVVSAAGPPTSTCDSLNILTCPTGSVLLAGNGTNIDGGTFSLNNAGYTRDIAPTLPGGTYGLVAKYSGDGSFTSSTSATTTFNVTPAPSTTTINFGPNPALVGHSFFFYAGASMTVPGGKAPSGTFTLYDGGSPVAANITTSPQGDLAGYPPSIGAAVENTIATLGMHSFTLKYNGDASYAPSTSAPFTVNAQYLPTVNVSLDSQNIQYGTPVTVTATVVSEHTTPAFAGKVTFSGYYTPIDGTVTKSITTDGSGNQVLTATVVTTPLSSETIQFSYNGDPNFADAQGFTNVQVAIPEFSLNAGSGVLTIASGQTAGTLQLGIVPASHVSSPVTLQCYGTTPYGTSCSIQPSTINLVNGVTTSAMITVGPQAGANAIRQNVPAVKHAGLVPPGNGPFWLTATLSGVSAMLLLFGPGRRKRMRTALGLSAICFICIAIGCGGGASTGGGGGTPPPPPPPQLLATTTTVATSAAEVPSGTQVTLTANVSGAGSPTGQVYFNVGYNVYGPVTLASGTASETITLGSNPGFFPVTAQYAGDSKNAASVSNAISETVPGSTTIYVNGTTSTLQHAIPVTVTIQ